jgi:hypothetical protein
VNAFEFGLLSMELCRYRRLWRATVPQEKSAIGSPANCHSTKEDRDMQRLTLTIAAASMLVGGVLAGTPANAEYMHGPMKNGDRCYTNSKTWGEMGFGYWTSCPKPAAAPANTPHHANAPHHNGARG